MLEDPSIHVLSNLRVNDLIHNDSSSWNMQVINGLFIPQIDAEIYKVPLLNTNVGDKLIWKSGIDGVYTGRSDYRTYMDHVEEIELPGVEGLEWALEY